MSDVVTIGLERADHLAAALCDVKCLVGRSLDDGKGPEIIREGFSFRGIAMTAKRIGGKHCHKRRQIFPACLANDNVGQLDHHGLNALRAAFQRSAPECRIGRLRYSRCGRLR